MMRALLTSLFAFFVAMAPAAADLVSPGIVTLGDFQIAGAGTQSTPAASIPSNLQGLISLSCQVRFFYGSGGTKTNVYLQSSLDQGQTWFDIANIAFATANGNEVINLSGLNSVTTPAAPSNLALADNTSFNGPMGDRLQAVVVSTGTYGGNTLASVRCATR